MINATISAIEKAQLRSDIPNFRVGDTVRVHYKIVEGDKERIQVFQGVVIKRHRAGARSTFTVRKISSNVGVERVFLEHSPRVDKIDILSRGVVRRARLFFLRDLSGKAARLKDERDKLPRKTLPPGETVYPAGFPAYAASRCSAQPRARA
jgi:large subunit ribosomal protein L19